MRSVGAFEAKMNFSALLDQAAGGEEIAITRRGKVVAKLVPAAPDEAGPDDIVARFRALRAGCTLGGLDWRELRDEGRR
jgi:prevent-host-death family protein